MGVGLYLVGAVEEGGERLLDAVERLVRERYGEELISADRGAEEGQSTLWVQTHPAAEGVAFSWDPGPPGRLVVSARTSTVGPGYHADWCEALRAIGDRLQIAWDPPDPEQGTGDETGYFETGDREALEQAMLRWLQAVLGVLLEPSGHTGLALSMPLSPRYQGPEGAWLLTQTGPRTEVWARAALADPRAGIDLFSWWETGRGAGYELGRVRVHQWLDVRWRPAATDEEERLGRELLARLARACRLDPGADIPWAAWEALHDDVVDADDDDLSPLVRARAQEADDGPLGYRERPVDVSLGGGWWITIPGSFATEVDDQGTWSAWEDEATVWATAFSHPSRGEEPVPAEEMLSEGPEDGEPLAIDGLDPELRCQLFQSAFDEDGETFWQLTAEIAAPGRLLVLTLVGPEETDFGWAEEVIRSVRG